MTINTSTQIDFFSGKNYMKRDSSSGSILMPPPTTAIYGGIQYVTRIVIAHNLGIVPFFNIFYEPFGDGVVWEALGNRIGDSTFNPRNTASTGPYLIAWADVNNLTLELGYNRNTLVGPYPVYYVIYKDYGIT